jgi:homoserine/homoserine lactone efflux protein
MPFSTWLPFFIATFAISLSPGPGAIAAMGAGLNHGFRRGQVMAFGLALGVWTQLLVVGVGLGALLATSALAFSVVKWAGAAYLVWLGVQQWRSPVSPISAPAAADGPAREAGVQPHLRRQLFLRGWTVNALNPKGTVFLLAVMPQFLDVAQPLLPQYLVIGATFGAVECTVMSGYVALAARVLRLLRSPRHIGWMNKGFGGLFIAAGAVLATFKRGA